MASGELAAHLAAISGRNLPSSVGWSKNSGGRFGLELHAAASAMGVLAKPPPPPRPPRPPDCLAFCLPSLLAAAAGGACLGAPCLPSAAPAPPRPAPGGCG